MIKIFITLILIQSCAIVGSSQVPGILYKSIAGYPDLKITKNFVDQQEYSFVKAQFGRGPIIILTLAYIDGEDYEWRSSDNSSIVTRNGKLIKTSGLKHNLALLSHLPPMLFSSESESRYLMELSNPNAIIEVKSDVLRSPHRENIFYLDFYDAVVFEETLTIDALDISAINKYWVNDQNQVLVTKQFVHPFLSPLHLEFFYKY